MYAVTIPDPNIIARECDKQTAERRFAQHSKKYPGNEPQWIGRLAQNCKDKNMADKYGFYTEEYETGSIETLMTGDGKTQFTDIDFRNGRVAVGMSYGQITQKINQKVHHPDGTLTTDIDVKWQVKFETPESIDAMIEALQRAKSNLGS